MINRILNKIKRTLLPIMTLNKELKYKSILFDFGKFERLVVLESTFGWNGIMMQRPQQIASSFDDKTLVLYHSTKDSYTNGLFYKKIKDNLYLINLDIYRKILAVDTSLPKNKFLIVYSTDPTSLKIIDLYKKNDFNVIYEYVDDLNPALSSKRVYSKLLAKHEYMMENKIKTVCTATRLFDGIKDRTEAVLITNGCDYEHFKAAAHDTPVDMRFTDNKITVGYYGAVAEWMDYGLLQAIANTGRYRVVLLGISYDGTFERSGLGTNENIYFLGKKDYAVLPSYAAHFDVCIIPFICNELTASTSPVKLFEYMAAEKPIVTTELTECKKYSSVLCASNHDEFIRMLDKAVELSDNEEYKKLLKKEALENTWHSKCKELLDFAIG